MRSELLNALHNPKNFDCGDAALKLFLQQLAGQQQRKGLGKTYVALSDEEMDVAGFISNAV